jgi:hypothetical protein
MKKKDLKNIEDLYEFLTLVSTLMNEILRERGYRDLTRKYPEFDEITIKLRDTQRFANEAATHVYIVLQQLERPF